MAAAVALTALVSAAGATGAAGDEPAVVATISPGNRQDSVSRGTLEAGGQQCPLYTGPPIQVQFSPGHTSEDTPRESWTLATVLSCMDTPIQLSAVTGIVVVGANGSPETTELTPGDLTTPSDFQNTSEAPIVSDGSPGGADGLFEYRRPQRSSSDNNGADQVFESSPSPININVYEGPALNVTVSASKTSVNAGDTVTFTSHVSGAGSSSLSYNWNFDGAGSATTPSATATFQNGGTYDIGLEVSDASGGVGTAPATVITVAGAPQQTTTTTTTTTTPPPSTGGGNPQGNGNSPHGTTSGPTGNPGGTPPPTTPKTRHGNHRGTTAPSHHGGSGARHRSSGTSGSGGGSASKGSTTSSTPNATTTSPIPSAPAPTPPAPAAHHTTKPGAAHHTTVAKLPSTAGQHNPVAIDGRLIADPRLLPLGASPLVRSLPGAPAPGPVVHGTNGISLLPALTGALTALLLLSLGAGRELRSRGRLRFGS